MATLIHASVIIPAFNAAPTLGECLGALRREGLPSPSVEVLVVDDASTDATRDVAMCAGVTVIDGAGHGPAAARNLGARLARGTFLLFLDADTASCPGWFDAMLAPFADPAVVAVKGRYTSGQRSLVARFAQLEFDEKYARLARASTVDFVDTGTAAFRRAVFLQAGGFDERFPAQSAEDVELAFRLAAQGARFAFNPQAVVRHRHSERLWPYLIKKARYGFFRVTVYQRFPRKALGDSYTPPLMGAQIALAGASGVLAFLTVLRVRHARWGLVGVLALFGGTTVPVVRRASARAGDRVLALAAAVPLLTFGRAWAQGLGILAGVVTLSAKRVRRDGTAA